jgi:ankyrin repeat protein
MKRPSNNTSPSNLTPPTSPRDLTPPISPRDSTSPTSPRQIQQPNTQITLSNTEEPSTTPPQFFQRPPVDRNNLFLSGSTNNPSLQLTDPFFNNCFMPSMLMYDTNKFQSGLTDDLFMQLVDPLSRRDFETAICIAGVNSIEEFYDLVDYRKKTLLMIAAKSGHTEVIKALLSKSNNPDSFICMKDESDRTALMYAATFGTVESIKVLLSYVSDRDTLVCMKDCTGMNALMFAISNGYYESVKVLLEGISNPEQLIFLQNNNNETALMLTNDLNRDDRSHNFSYFLPEDGIWETEDLFQAKIIKNLLSFVNDRDKFICMKDSNGSTALIHAAKGHNPESVKALLANVKNREQLICMKDLNGWTALMYAAHFHDYVSIKNLLEGVSDPEQLIFMENNDNETAMTLAMETRNRYVSFSDESEDYDEQELEGLHKAKTIRVETIKALLSVVKDKDAFICEQDADGKTMLLHTLHLDSAELIKFLLESVNNSDELLSMKDAQGKNLLMHAASSGKAKSIEVILSVVKNPEAFAMIRDSEGMTALTHAIISGETKSIEAILRNVNNPDQLAFMKNQKGYNALMLEAIVGGYYTTLALLNHVKNPAELIYSTDSKGNTALMLCCANQSIENIDSNSITAMLEKTKEIRDPYYKFSLTYSKGKKSYIPLKLDYLIFIKNTKWMNAFTIALDGNNVGAALTLLNSTTDILRLFTEKNLKKRTAIDLFHKEYGAEMCDALIERVEQLQLLNNSEDLVIVMSLLRERKARYNQAN